MKNIRLRLSLFLVAIAGLFLAAAPVARASAESHVDEGLAVSKNWIAEIDASQYDESYLAGSGQMHDKVTQERWSQVLKAIRASWGGVVSRKQISHVYQGNGFEGGEGEFLLITYETSFEKLPNATEFVVLRWEDGKWRGAGYNAGAKPSSTADNPPEEYHSSTETHTEEHVKPMPQ